ncbi:MAG: hypothetical protein KA155_05880 [Alphaproteobacteria bacterium]|jgi:hypothetical protein|nr:hypothetical protein [Alphaproteobacteria bacterium]
MNGLDVIAILKGFGADIVFSLLLGLVASFIVGYIGVISKEPVTSLPLVVSLVIGLLGAFGGGYMTARSAQQEPMFNVIALGVVIIVIGAVLAFFSQFPIWYNIASFALVVPFTYAGGYIFMNRKAQ